MANPPVPAKPGKLGDPNLTLLTDYRTDRRIVAALEAFGPLDGGVEPVTATSTIEQALAYCEAFEQATAQAHPMMLETIPSYPLVTTRTEVIRGADGNDISLYLHLPVNVEPGPCVVHMHGGGMVLMTAADPAYIRWRNDLANAGLRVVGVEFRNGGGALGNHPFPAGLNDCAAAVNWVHNNRAALGITSVMISGESGGGNLAIATALKAKTEDWLDQIDGVYAFCPYISGSYAKPPEELVSLRENDGYSMDCGMMAALVKVYDPLNDHAANPLAWPYQASADELEGLPPMFISVNELDPLRDEGLEFYRKLLAAGVSVMARTVHGTHHAGDLSFPDITPDIYQQSLGSLLRFAQSLSRN